MADKIKAMKKFLTQETGNSISNADMARLEAIMGKQETGNTISERDRVKMARMMSMKKGMEMGGEVMDTTKSMPVGMMGGGKVKPMKMNMGGVVPGRGGKFKGVM